MPLLYEAIQDPYKTEVSRDTIVIYPRAEVEIGTVVNGQDVLSKFIPSKVSLVGRSHNKASELQADFMGSALPFQVDTVEGMHLRLYMGLVDSVDESVSRKLSNLRFIGYADTIEQDHEAHTVKIKARDLSALCMDHKPLISINVDGRRIDPTPLYSDTLGQAINRILSVVPGWRIKTDRPPFTVRENEFTSIDLGSLVEGRSKKGPITLKPDWTAWQAIEHVCGLAAKLVHVELDELVIRRPEDAFGGDSTVKYEFIFGGPEANIQGPKFNKKFITQRKGIRVVGSNPKTRKKIEAVYPSDEVMRKEHPRRRPAPPKAKTKTSKKAKPKQLPEPDREVVWLGAGAYSQDYLDALAKKIWLEKAHQEVDGTITTPLWDDKILALQNGDRIRIKVRPDIEDELRKIGDDALASKFLQERYDFDKEAADILVDASKKPLTDIYYLSVPTFEWPSDKLASFKVINLIKVLG